MGHYLRNKDAAEKHNQRFKQGLSTFQVDVNNQFGDLSHDEALESHTGYIHPIRYVFQTIFNK
jgi:hypothetical protein